jgi:uncharacterized protein YggE
VRTSRNFIVAALVLAAAPFALAEEPRDRISTTVRGRAVAPADEITIELVISDSAESAEEAQKKYEDKLDKVLETLKNHGKENPAEKKRKKKDEAPKPRVKKNAEDDDEDEEPPARRPKKAPKKTPAADEDDDAPVPAKKPKKDEKKSDDKADEKKDDEKKPEEKKPEEKKPEEKKPEEKKPEEKKLDEKKPEDKKPEPELKFEVRESALTFGVRQAGDPNQVRMRRMMNQPNQKDAPEIRFASSVSIVFKEVSKYDPKLVRRKFAELIDRAVNQNVEIGYGPDGDHTPASVRFGVASADALKQKAYEDAMRQARERAADLARMAGRELGRVLTVRDNTALPQGIRKNMQPYVNPYQYQQVANQSGEDVTMDVTIECDLYVEFELK